MVFFFRYIFFVCSPKIWRKLAELTNRFFRSGETRNWLLVFLFLMLIFSNVHFSRIEIGVAKIAIVVVTRTTDRGIFRLQGCLMFLEPRSTPLKTNMEPQNGFSYVFLFQKRHEANYYVQIIPWPHWREFFS